MIKLVSIADVFTLLNIVFGLLAVVTLAVSPYVLRLIISFILLAAVCDGLDGLIARHIRASDIGDNLEGMADMLSFCVAPSLLVYCYYRSSIFSYLNGLFVVGLLFFVLCGCIRLASFHKMKKKGRYVGFPTPASGLIVVLLVLYIQEMFYFFPLIILIAFGMISSINFPKPGVKIDAVAAFLIILTIIFWTSYYSIAPSLLLISLVIYALVGPLYQLKR